MQHRHRKLLLFVRLTTPRSSGTGVLYGPLHEKVWGPYGFYDAFSQTDDWYPQKYLAIDQGPIAVMIENHRSELLWRLFMSHPDVQNGLRKLGFESPVLQ